MAHFPNRPINTLGEAEVKAYLTHLSVGRNVAVATQQLALCAIVFLFLRVLEKPLGDFSDFVKAKRPRRLPVVLSQQEVQRLLSAISDDTFRLMAGMRLMECIRLRVLDVDFPYQKIHVRAAKGNKDRVVTLPKRYTEPLKQQFDKVRSLHQNDLAQGFGEVYLAEALARKYPSAPQAI